MITPRSRGLLAASASLLLSLLASPLMRLDAQPIATPWGTLDGIRVDGQRFAFEASLRQVDADWSGYVQSQKYNWEDPKPVFTLEGTSSFASHFLQGTKANYAVRITEPAKGKARYELALDLQEERKTAGTFFCVDLPSSDYASATLSWISDGALPPVELTPETAVGRELVKVRAKGFRLTTGSRQVEFLLDAETDAFVRRDFIDQPAHLNDPLPRVKFVSSDSLQAVANTQVYFAVAPGGATAGTKASLGCTVSVDGSIDRAPVNLVLDATKPGRAFAGVGGNYRMYQPALDAQVVDYVFENLNVTWGRVAFFWNEWQPKEDDDPVARYKAGALNDRFMRQFAIARTLAQKRIPTIVSVWVQPDWAKDPGPRPPKGIRLNPAKLEQAADSIAGYLEFLKRETGLEAVLFSFNETDYGVDVLQSPEEHAQANKIIGQRLAQRGLITKMLLADTGAGTVKAHEMAIPSRNDPTLLPYLGAVAFHTYHGCTERDLRAWSETARALNLPLLVTECGPDSAAHRYPRIFTVPWFAMQEIETYIRIAAYCQPNTIMPWQFNANYALLAGSGIYGDDSPLHTTQRFWNMKQLGSTAPGAYWLPFSADRPDITCAAAADLSKNDYAIHIVNTGATREAFITGVPKTVRKMRVCVTNEKSEMAVTARPSPVDGKIRVVLPAFSYVSLFSE